MPIPTPTQMFQITSGLLAILFLRYGMDIRRKAGARNFVGPVYQLLMKLSSLALIGGFLLLVLFAQRVSGVDVLGLAVMASGTCFVVAAKHDLGTAHTFTGQYLDQPALVTRGVYAATRNPLYLGVFQCELGAAVFSLHQMPLIIPQRYAVLMVVSSLALTYAVLFNSTMALRESRYLEEKFGDQYRRYSALVPFLVPSLTRRQEVTPMSSINTIALTKRSFHLTGKESLSVLGAWYDGNPLTTHLLNAYTLLIPHGEHFIIRSCRRYLNRSTPEMQAELEGLFFQEGSHSREHGYVLEAMRQEGLSLDVFRRMVDWFYYNVLEPMTPPQVRLATAAAIEHHNAIIATYFLNQQLLKGSRNAELRRLFLWHFAEEIEHKETVYKLLQSVSRSWFLRTIGLALSFSTFLAYWWIGTLLLCLKTWRAFPGPRYLERGLFRAILKESARYLRPGFHPSVEESRLLLSSALSELQCLGVEQTKSAEQPAPRMLPAKFRTKMIRTTERSRDIQTEHKFFFNCIEGYDGAWVRSEGERRLNFCTYSYLGLLRHPDIDDAGRRALEQYGTGTHGVRLLGGNLRIHEQLESRIASFFRREAAITFSSGFMTNLAVIGTLLGKGDYILCDERNHASIVDGCRLSRAAVLRFRHSDMSDLACKLSALPEDARKLIVVDAVYSMDGDIAPLPELITLRDRFSNTILMADEAHSLGVLGSQGRGIEEHFDCHGQIDVLMGTLSKTIPCQGGYIAGSHELITYLRYNARGFIFSAALSPVSAAAANAALRVIEKEGELRRGMLMSSVHYFIRGLRKEGFDPGNTETAIVPVLLGSEALAFEMARQCNLAGIYVMPVVYPAVPRGKERLRINVTYDHRREDLDFALQALVRARNAVCHATLCRCR